MSISIEPMRQDDRESWDEYVERSPHGTVFHRYTALIAQASHSGTTLHPLVGYKGDEPIGVFPVFTRTKGPFSAAFSPPPRLRVAYLGPALLNMEKLKQRKREQRHRRFIEGCLEWLDAECDPGYVSLRTGWSYDDLRPVKWNAFSVVPSYTYVVDLGVDESAIIDRFSRTTRRRIQNTDNEFSIEVGGVEAIEWIVERVNDRFDEQGKSTPLTASFVIDLHDGLPDGTVRPYVLSIDDELVTGTILLVDGTVAHRWQGGVKTNVEIPANELLEWRMMRDARQAGVTAYDIVDANVPRLNGWKSKFGPTVRTYHNAKRTSAGMNVAASIYEYATDRISAD